MALNPFNKDLGIHQGRIVNGVSAVYELGHALLRDAEMRVGDKSEIAQNIVLAAQTRAIVPLIRVVIPGILPGDAKWELSAWLNGTKRVHRFFTASKRPITISDWQISTTGANAAPTPNQLVLRLQLVALDTV